MFYLTNQIQNPTVQFLELLIDNPNEIFNDAINIENNRRTGNVGLTKYFSINKNNKKPINLSLKKKSSKNVAKYYLNESDEDISKLGIGNDSEEEVERVDSDEEDEKVDNNKYNKLFMTLGKI